MVDPRRHRAGRVLGARVRRGAGRPLVQAGAFSHVGLLVLALDPGAAAQRALLQDTTALLQVDLVGGLQVLSDS